MRREQAVRTTSPLINSADEGALVSDVEATTIRSLGVTLGMRMTRRKSMKSIDTSTCNQQPCRERRGSDEDQKEERKEEEEVDRMDIK
jgi:hypothetical protein